MRLSVIHAYAYHVEFENAKVVHSHLVPYISFQFATFHLPESRTPETRTPEVRRASPHPDGGTQPPVDNFGPVSEETEIFEVFLCLHLFVIHSIQLNNCVRSVYIGC